jgi:hypothetical protein
MTRILIALFLVGCSAGAEPALCGWEPAGVGFTGTEWETADTSQDCGYLLVGESPCDIEPARAMANDGAAITSWRRPGVECSPSLTLKR